MHAIIVGPDRDLESALTDADVAVDRIDGPATGATLERAGIETADLLILTDVGEATAVPIAKDVNPDLRVVIVSPDTMPEFLRRQVDLAVAPDVLDPAVIAEELTGGN